MKVRIGPYKNWFGPYQLANALCFWVKPVEDKWGNKDKPDWVHKFGEWLAYGSIEPEPTVGEITTWNRDRKETWLYKFLLWIDKFKKQEIKVQIDRWDTWSMDTTLAYIVLPMLKKLKNEKHGVPIGVDLSDLPPHLSVVDNRHDDWSDQKDLFEHMSVCNPEHISIREAQWEWIMDEMIFAFEHKLDDTWQEKFYSGEHDMQWKKLEDGMSQLILGPNDTYRIDHEGMQKVQDRISNGFRLFGKYYENLWD